MPSGQNLEVWDQAFPGDNLGMSWVLLRVSVNMVPDLDDFLPHLDAITVTQEGSMSHIEGRPFLIYRLLHLYSYDYHHSHLSLSFSPIKVTLYLFYHCHLSVARSQTGPSSQSAALNSLRVLFQIRCRLCRARFYNKSIFPAALGKRLLSPLVGL